MSSLFNYIRLLVFDPFSFCYRFVEENGTVVKEEGAIVDNVLIKKGRYSYTSPEGVPVEIKYIADHNGYRIL